ncbi:flavin reductase family protein [Nocardia sp. NPDC003482]
MTNPFVPQVAAVDQAGFRDYCRKLTAGVAVVSTATADGWAGTTVSSVTSVSAAPPILSCCLDRRSRTLEHIQRSELFAVNLLAAEQRELSIRFSSSADRAARSTVPVETIAGVPALTDCLAVGVCALHRELWMGDHIVLFGLLLDTRVRADRRPLIHHDRGYL